MAYPQKEGGSEDSAHVGTRQLRLHVACAPRRITRRVLKLRAVPIGTVLNLRTTTSQKCAALPRRARI